MNNIMKQK